MNLILLELVNLAANAVIAKQAEAARLLLATQALAKCREENNPYDPGSNPLGPSRLQMWGPDPCEIQEKDVAQAKAALAASQTSAAPTPQNLASQPAAQLSVTWDDSGLFLPETVNAELPELESQWDPQGVEEVMNQIAQEMMQIDHVNLRGVGQEFPSNEVLELMEVVEEGLTIWSLWIPDPIKWPKKLRWQLQLKDPGWAKKWEPTK